MPAFSIQKKVYFYPFTLLYLAIYLASCGSDKPSPPKTKTISEKATKSAKKTTGDASISGIVSFSGAVPKLKSIDMGSVAECQEQHSSEVMSEALVLGPNNTIGNVIVQIKTGLPTDSKYDPPSKPAVLDQIGCIYTPHILAVQTGQIVKFKNSDKVPHNVHTLSEKNKAFNKSVNKDREIEYIYDQEEIFFVKCDIHPWMKSYVSVVSHPFFGVTQSDGKFEIKKLPPGKYTVEVWHERLGKETKEIEIVEGQSAELNFTLTKS